MQAQALENHENQETAECVAIRALYQELLHVARFHLRREPLGYLWSPDALINEAYIRVVVRCGKEWVAQENVLALWSRIMRNVLIDNGRAFRAAKRNRGDNEPLVGDIPSTGEDPDFAIGLKRAVNNVRAIDPRCADVLQMRFADGFTLQETARALKLSPETVKRMSRAGRRQLLAELAIN